MTKTNSPSTDIHLLPQWHLLFASIMALAIFFVFSEVHSTEHRLGALFLSALLCLWYAISVWWVEYRGRAQTPYLLGFFIVGWLNWFALTEIHPAYMFMLFILFPHLFMCMMMLWAGIGAVILTALVMLRQSAFFGQDSNTLLIFMSIALAAGIVVARFVEGIITESLDRYHLIMKLESTRRELADAERQAGILQERQRLAGEIHDTLAQGLISIVMHLEAAENTLTDTPTAQHHLNEARTIARTNLSEARRVVWGLLPEILEQHPFEQALQQTVDEWSASHHISAETSVIGTRTPLSSAQEVVVLRVLQEALSNIAKHAAARKVTVTLSYMPNAAVIDVHDDGKGFIVTEKPRNGQTGFGLLNMRQRLEQLQGTLTIESSADEGTTLVAEIPLP